MKIISFNTNGIRARPHQLQALVEGHQPDIIGIQETKVQDPDFPVAPEIALQTPVFRTSAQRQAVVLWILGPMWAVQ